MQSQKTQGFCIADFATLSDERRSRSKIFPLFIWIKEPCVRKFEGLERWKLLGISQTIWINDSRGKCLRKLDVIILSTDGVFLTASEKTHSLKFC